MSTSKPFFIVTIDTEGDNLWSRPKSVTTRNAEYLPRFQSLCESYGLRPVYLVNHEMAGSSVFQKFGRDVLARDAGEIGMHLHAWDTPPVLPLTRHDDRLQPYLIEYADDIMRQKIDVLTDLLEQAFETKMRSHRAGRWALDERYVRLLLERGYTVDCSVTPGVSWSDVRGGTRGGTDYTAFPGDAYVMDPDDIRRAGSKGMLEVPVTTVCRGSRILSLARAMCPAGTKLRRVFDRHCPEVFWLRPTGRNLKRLLATVDQAVAAGRGHLEFVLHSSELMPGGSPYFRDAHSIDALYEDLEALFSTMRDRTRPATLTEFRSHLLGDTGG